MNRIEAKKYILETCGEGWLKLVDQVYDNIPDGIEVTQLFQKYAGLHAEFHPDSPQFDSFLYDIQEISEKTCEKCGKYGYHYIIDGWEYTRCKAHCENGICLNG